MKLVIKSAHLPVMIAQCILTVLLTISCNITPASVAGGGSDTEVSGRILPAAGIKATGTIVSLIDVMYDPGFDNQLSLSRIDTTDVNGMYRFDNVTPGIYNILAEHPELPTKLWIKNIEVSTDIIIPDSCLEKTARLEMQLPDSITKQSGVVSIPGTTIFTNTSGLLNEIVLESVPKGIISKIHFRNSSVAPTLILYNNIVIDSDTIKINPYTAWEHKGKVFINTTYSGEFIREDIFDFPILLRLNSSNFDFTQTKKKGEDIRIVKSDNTAIPFEIEKWDSSGGSAIIWIKIDTIYSDNNTQFIQMYWGNRNGKSLSNSAAVFDTADGFEGVWHLHQSGGTVQVDATPNHFDATPVEMDGANDVTGVIGVAHDFDGSSQYLVVENAQNSRLDVHWNKVYAVSAWVYSRSTQKDQSYIVSKGSEQFGLMVNAQNRFTFYGGLSELSVGTTTTAEMNFGTWIHLAGVRDNSKLYLFVNGNLTDSISNADNVYNNIADHFYDFFIGRQSDSESLGFDGIIDEVRVESRAISQERVKLCYGNQKADQNFLTFAIIR